MSRPPLLRAEKLCRTYPDGKVQALVNVSLSIAQGEYLAIMGNSGSGKSTLLNMLGALDRPDSGEVYYLDQAYSHLPSLDRFRSERVGFVFQSFFLLPTLTALENVQVPLFESRLSARERAAKASRLLSAVSMSHRATHCPPQLSVGERQRAAIARALAQDPTLLLADEPTGNLDSESAEAVLELFSQLHKERGLTLVLVTHSPEVAARGERLVQMRGGRIVSSS